MKHISVALSVSLLAFAPFAAADNSHAQSSASGGNATGIGHGGAGGLGGTGIGNGGAGGNGFGGEAHGGAGGDANAEGGTGGVGYGGTGQGGAASNAGNNQSASMHFEQARTSPSGFAFAPMPTSMCQGSTGIWASFVGGLGFASSRDIEWCRIMELGRTFAGMGRADIGVKIMCKFDKYANQLDECKSL